MRVLIVEDDVVQVESLEMVLRAAGHVCYLARNGLSARQVLGTHTPDAVLLDIRLPDESGRTFLDWLRSRPETAATAVIVTTGLPCERVEDLLARPGVTVLEKPYSPAVLLDTLKRTAPAPESDR